MIVVLFIAALAMTGCSKSSPTGAVSANSSSKAAAPAVAASSGPAVNAGRATGAKGSVVAIDVSLSGGNGEVVATATEVRYDASRVRVAATAQGGPDCELAAALLEPQVKKQIFAKERLAEGDAILRVGLLGIDNANPLPDGKLFTCRFQISETAAAGELPLRVTTQGSDAKASAVAVGGADGAITVN